MGKYMELSPVDEQILNSCKSMLEGISEYVGPGYEIVLHSLSDLDHSAIKVFNGHYTGREEGAPITDLALSMLKRIRDTSDHKSLIYFNRSKKGAPIRSATIPVMGEQERIIGLLCMNFYMDIPLNMLLDGLNKVSEDSASLSETFTDDVDQLIINVLEEAKSKVLNNESIASVNKNKEIIAVLHAKGIFSLKDAVNKVATMLNITKNTVYMHVRNLNSDS